MYLMRKRRKFSLAWIGMQLGNRDHTTAMNGINRITNLLTVDPELATQVEWITRDLDAAAKVAAERVQTIDKMLFSSTLGALIAKYLGVNLRTPDDE